MVASCSGLDSLENTMAGTPQREGSEVIVCPTTEDGEDGGTPPNLQCRQCMAAVAARIAQTPRAGKGCFALPAGAGMTQNSGLLPISGF